MNERKRMFKSYILERGWDYYQFDRVREIKPTMHGYTAVVDGTDAYTVDIIIQDGYVIDMICDCPYVDDGNYCKHMAAVLYKITEEHFEKYKQLYEENQKVSRRNGNYERNCIEVAYRVSPQDSNDGRIEKSRILGKKYETRRQCVDISRYRKIV